MAGQGVEQSATFSPTETTTRNVTYLTGVATALLEHACTVVSWHIPVAPHHIVDVLAQGGGVGSVFATTNAELVVRNEVGPFVQLLRLTERAREHQTANWVSWKDR